MKETIQLILKGMSMGIAEVIPGVSGGTLAFITGIYERLLSAIRSFDLAFFEMLKSQKFRDAWYRIDGFFLVRVLMGMAIGFVFGLKLIVGLLVTHPIQIWSFFFGLILASIPLIAKQVNRWGFVEVLGLIMGSVTVYWITVASPAQGSDNWAMVFLSGVIGISALMLPGLSGSFVLLLMGMYTVIMPSIERFIHAPFGSETGLIIVFAAGMVVGLFTFSRLLGHTFQRHRNPTLAVLTGFLIGSLNKVWPWQSVLSMRTNSKGEQVVQFSESVLPDTFAALSSNPVYGTDPQTLTCTVIMMGAVGVIFFLDRFSSTK